MIYAHTTVNEEIVFKAFPDNAEREAAEWLVEEIGDPDVFWVDENGKLARNNQVCLDYSVNIFFSEREAVIAQADLDPECIALALRKLCDAIEEATDNE